MDLNDLTEACQAGATKVRVTRDRGTIQDKTGRLDYRERSTSMASYHYKAPRKSLTMHREDS